MIVGFSAIDLRVLLNGMVAISGWYNIVDFSGRINGQIKVCPVFKSKIKLNGLINYILLLQILIEPKEDLNKFKPVTPENPLLQPLSIDCIPPPPPPLDDETEGDGGTVFSRTLKRKFTELEEISQRLRARLFDIAGDANVDPDDEFENDLNTKPPEEDEDDLIVDDGAGGGDDDDGGADGFNWLRTATVAMPSGCEASGAFDELCSSVGAAKSCKSLGLQMIGTAYGGAGEDDDGDGDESANVDSVFDWERLLQDDGASIVPPNIYKKFMDAAAGSVGAVVDAESHPPTTGSSSTSSSGEQERIRLISTALQKAVITEVVTSGAEASAKTTIASGGGGGGGCKKNVRKGKKRI